MKSSPTPRTLATAITLSLLLPATALAEEAAPAEAPKAEEEAGEGAAEKEEDVFAPLDRAFGKYLVSPLATVLFFDVWFWDQQMVKPADVTDVPAFLAEKPRVGKETIVGVDVARGFELPTRTWGAKADDVGRLPLGAPVEMPLGKATAIVEGTPPDNLTAKLKKGAVDITGLEQDPVDPTPEGEPPSVMVTGYAPFPVKVAVAGDAAQLLEQDVPPEHVPVPPLKVGEVVRMEDGKQGVVTAIEGDALKLESSDKRYHEDEVKNPFAVNIPFIVLWMVIGATFFTLRMSFINLRGFKHAIQVVQGKYDNPDDPGEVNHFQALASALSATVGLGNIAGVAVAVGMGGPGAIFWMIVAGFLGMSSKFVECTLGQMYRHVDEHGVVLGGPMRYLDKGLEDLGIGGAGKGLAMLFAVMCIGGSLGGGNMFQANQAFSALAEAVTQVAPGTDISSYAWVFGLVLAVLVGLVIIGGIKRIGAAAGFIVPFMCGFYLLAGFWVLITNLAVLPEAFSFIVGEAFSPRAGLGGMIGVLMVGFQRAAFSNEAGVGSAAIAHSAASTDEPVREGLVASIGPFIDTLVVCTMTGLVVVVTGAYKDPEYADKGVAMTQAAFGTVISWFPLLLSIAVLLFAFSTMISWSYYGERCFTFLFGHKTSMAYRVIFCFFVVIGAVLELGNVIGFSDLMILGMAFPNMFGAVLLSSKVRARLDDYWARYKSGEMKQTG